MLLGLGRGLDQVGEPRAHRIGHRHVRHAARAKEALLAREGAVDELVHQHEMAGRVVLLQRPAGRDGDEIGDPGALQGVDVGAEVDRRRRHLVAAAVPGQEADRQAIELGKQDLVGRRAPGRFHVLPVHALQVRGCRRARCRRRCRERSWSWLLLVALGTPCIADSRPRREASTSRPANRPGAFSMSPRARLQVRTGTTISVGELQRLAGIGISRY